MRQSTARAHVYEAGSDATATAAAERGTRLSNHSDRSGTTVSGVPSIAIGSLFGVVGVGIAFLSTFGWIEPARGVPWWIVAIVGMVFALAGVSFVVHGMVCMEVQRRAARLRPTHAREPWIWDHPWDDQGSRDDSGRRIARAIWGSAFLALFLIPFNWIGFLSPERPAIFAVVAVLMDGMLLASIARIGYLIAQRSKYGPAMLRFRRFPFHPGGEVEVHLARPAHLAGVETPQALLRCVQERYEVEGSGKNRRQVVVAYELWSARETAEFRRGEFIWRFVVPAGLPGTALSERPPRYWELELRVEVPGIDFAGTFLVPVYAGVRGR